MGDEELNRAKGELMSKANKVEN